MLYAEATTACTNFLIRADKIMEVANILNEREKFTHEEICTTEEAGEIIAQAFPLYALSFEDGAIAVEYRSMEPMDSAKELAQWKPLAEVGAITAQDSRPGVPCMVFESHYPILNNNTYATVALEERVQIGERWEVQNNSIVVKPLVAALAEELAPAQS